MRIFFLENIYFRWGVNIYNFFLNVNIFFCLYYYNYYNYNYYYILLYIILKYKNFR